MTDTPKFEVIDRRKMKAEEEQGASHSEASAPATPAEEPAASGGPRLVVNDASRDSAAAETAPGTSAAEMEAEMPAPPTAEESNKQKAAYDASSQRLEDLMRAQNPAVGPTPPVTFDAPGAAVLHLRNDPDGRWNAGRAKAARGYSGRAHHH